MAGGQERILRRRIKSVQSTKKITRAMELIAASRIVKAQARVHAAQPYADEITEVVRDLQAAGGGSNSPLLVPRPEIRRVAHVVHRRRPRPVRRVQLDGDPRRRRQIAQQQALGPRRRSSSWSAARPRATSGSANYRSMPSFTGFTDSPTYEDARRDRGVGRRAVRGRRARPRRARLHALRLRRRQEVVVRPLLPLDREGFEGGDGQAAKSGGAATTSSSRARRDPRHAAAALRRSARLRRAAERGRVGARGPPARDEGRDRQRRGADHHLHAAS